MTSPDLVTMPPLSNIPGVDLIATGEWNLSTGPATFTTEDLRSAVDAAQCPSIGLPVIKLGHVDPRFDGEPAVGRVANMALAAEGNKITGDLVGMPGWLGPVMPSAYPNRSIEGLYDVVCQQGHAHPFVITGLALLGVTRPGIGVLSSLEDVAVLYGVAASTPGLVSAGRSWTVQSSGGAMPQPLMAAGVTVDDVRRAYFDQPNVGYAMWICEMQLDPAQLIVCDDATDRVYRVPVTISGDAVTFGDAQEVEVEYVDVSASAGIRAGAVLAAAGPRTVAASWPARETSRRDVAASDPTSDPEPPEVPEEPELVISASGQHAGFTGTHSHPHSAYGAQGGDSEHSHEHTHAGDGSHSHSHGSAASTEGTTDVELTEAHQAAIRARLGLEDGTEITAEHLAAALAPPATPPTISAAALPAGTILLDREEWEAAQRQISRGVEAREHQLRSDRDREIDAAVQAGKFSVARRGHWERVYDADPAGTKALLATLTKGVVPLEDIGQPGGDPDEIDAEYASLFPPQR